MERLVFIDTETTSLRTDRRAWDIGMIVREPDLPDTEHQWFVDASNLDLANADPFSLRVGRFYDRHPNVLPWDAGRLTQVHSERSVMERIEELTRGAHLVGSGVHFDAETLAPRMRAHGILPSWHYHLIDTGALMLGHQAALGRGFSLPYSTESLSDLLGVEKAPDSERHTALGDARWCARIYDKVMGR